MARRLIIVHGLVLNASNTVLKIPDIWESNVWGDPRKGVYGRAAHALRLFQEAPDHTSILWGCGQIEPADRPISRITFDLAMVRAEEVLRSGADAESFRWSITSASLFADKAQTTDQEVAEVVRLCADGSYGEVVVVSCRSHTPRCLNLAMFHLGLKGVRITASPADTDFGKSVVLEHAHRADRPDLGLPAIAMNLFKIAGKPGGVDNVHEIAAHIASIADGTAGD